MAIDWPALEARVLAKIDGPTRPMDALSGNGLVERLAVWRLIERGVLCLGSDRLLRKT